MYEALEEGKIRLIIFLTLQMAKSHCNLRERRVPVKSAVENLVAWPNTKIITICNLQSGVYLIVPQMENLEFFFLLLTTPIY